MRKISTIISVLLMATVAASGAISTQVATVGLEDTQEAPKNNGNTNTVPQRTISPLPNAGSPGNQNSQCHTDWGYNRCTDILDLGGILRFDLSRECVSPYMEHAKELQIFARGEYYVLTIEDSSSSFSIWIMIICGEGDFVIIGTGMSHGDFSVETAVTLTSFAKDIVDVVDGASPHEAVIGAFIDAITSDDYRFEDHDGDGIQNYEDDDYEGLMASNENAILKELRDWASGWLDNHRLVWDEETKEWVQTGPEDTEDEDEDEDDEDGDEDDEGEEDDPSLTDDPGCPEDSPAFC